MLTKIVFVVKLFAFTLISYHGVVANNEIITRDFDGKIDDKILTYYYDHESTSLYYLNSSLKLSIINFKSNNVNTIPLNTKKDFLSTLPNTWVPNIPLNANIELIDSQVINQVYKKLSELKIVMSDKDLFLIDNGGGMVFKIDLNEYFVERHDSSFTTMNKFGGDVFVYNDDIYHHGGYGLYVTNSTLIKYNKNYKTWDEIVVSDEFPNPKGITNHTSLIWKNEYFVIGGNSSVNQQEIKNNQLIKYNFETSSWKSLGNLSFDFNKNVDISTYKQFFYIFNRDLGILTTINVDNMLINSYSMKNEYEINNGQLGNDQIIFICNHLYSASQPQKSYTEKSNEELLLENNSVNYFVANTSTYQASIFKSLKMSNFIDFESKENLILLKEKKSRNEFMVPLIIILSILILNSFYRNYTNKKIITKKKPYSYESGVLKFKNKLISTDSNTKLILDLLHSSEKITSNEVVALLVSNGMSMDYASKIKNKIIEKLNDKFQFVTGSDDKFIATFKSREDKRIQVLKLIK
jgi:hypothetical protein